MSDLHVEVSCWFTLVEVSKTRAWWYYPWWSIQAVAKFSPAVYICSCPDMVFTVILPFQQPGTRNTTSMLSQGRCAGTWKLRYTVLFSDPILGLRSIQAYLTAPVFIQARRKLERSQDGAPSADFQAEPMGLGEALKPARARFFFSVHDHQHPYAPNQMHVRVRRFVKHSRKDTVYKNMDCTWTWPT